MKKNFYFIIRVLVILAVSSISLFAQGDAEITPVDGGASFLAAAGLAYGLKKVRDFKRKSKAAEEE